MVIELQDICSHNQWRSQSIASLGISSSTLLLVMSCVQYAPNTTSFKPLSLRRSDLLSCELFFREPRTAPSRQQMLH